MTSIKFRALTHNDHKLFFEAIGEHGKDFQNIQQYMTQKGNKSKTAQNNNNNKSIDPQEKREQYKKEDDKKREQIRNFYNKLYAKLSQLIGKLDDRVEKVYQELYLLINYGEIWKKHGFIFNNKTKRLLEDLVYQGSTTLRFKNKNVRLRTPPCKALKKINQIGVDEKVKVVTTRELPKDVIVEFHPATNEDWLRVQSLSQNPRVRAKLSIQKRLTNILKYLEDKWSVSQDKLNHTVDAWLKLDSSNEQPISRLQSDPMIRLKPSAHHELKEVNITRVVPDNHLDLSLTAYIKRLGDTKPSSNTLPGTKVSTADPTVDHLVSLTTPDCSLLFEKSCTSDQPSIAQARKHLNLLQSLTGALDGCENSRVAYEDTQDPLNSMSAHITTHNEANLSNIQPGSDSQNVDFSLPKNVTLGDFFKMANEKVGGDSIINNDETANDAFPISIEPLDCKVNDQQESPKDSSAQNHLVDIKRLAEGWTRLEESSMTIGELYLALKCPEKIILEYAFEPTRESHSDDTLIFKLLTAASLSLAKIERQRHELQDQQQSCSKLKRRKMGPGCQNNMTLHDIETTNQRVEEALKQLQPTRLCRRR